MKQIIIGKTSVTDEFLKENQKLISKTFSLPPQKFKTFKKRLETLDSIIFRTKNNEGNINL